MTAIVRHAFLLLLIAPLPQALSEALPPDAGRPAALRVAAVQYLADTGEPMAALVARRRLPESASASINAQLDARLAERMIDFGLLNTVAQRYRAAHGFDTPAKARNRVWFALARAQSARGDYRDAAAALARIRGQLPPEVEKRLPPLAARIQMARGHFEQAAETLRETEYQHDPYTRYNLGVALVRAGRVAEGAGELDAVGRIQATNETERALRDHANLALAYAYLEIGQGATARALFQRVRLDGPAANKALLGLGWAELAPDGTPQERTVLKEIACREDPARLLPDTLPVLRRMPREACGPPQIFRDTDRFQTKTGGEDPVARHRRALVPWLELLRRNADDLSVQEGWTTVPYAYARLGARTRADGYYARAIRLLEQERHLVNTTMDRLQSNTEDDVGPPPGVEPGPGWFVRHWRLPGASEAYLQRIAAEPGFWGLARQMQDLAALDARMLARREDLRELQATLQGRRTALYRADIAPPDELQRQESRLRTTGDRLATLRDKLAASSGDLGQALRQRALAAARKHLRYLDTYITNTRLGHARLLETGGDSAATAQVPVP